MVPFRGRFREGRDKGFTIVELLIVIVVIGILALLVVTTYSGIQAKARNAKDKLIFNRCRHNLKRFSARMATIHRSPM